MSCYLLSARWGDDEYMSFQRAVAWSEMQAILSRIWTQIIDLQPNVYKASSFHTKLMQKECEILKVIKDKNNKGIKWWLNLIDTVCCAI